MSSTLPPLSLYIHFPWCIKKCPYCDFNSHESGSRSLPESQYINKLLGDLDSQKNHVAGRCIETVFMGGGTPSLFSGESIARLLSRIKERVKLSDEAEITLESNPGTLDKKNLTGYICAGVNRLSIGVQSFQDVLLQQLGRIHSGEEAIEMIKAARKCGFTNINLDLMHGLPGQTTAQALFDLEQALSQNPTHISWYQLTIEPNTLFYKRPPALPEEEVLWSIQQAGQQLLEESGYCQYEVSAYALPGYECRHNLNYWRFGDYLGLGAGAHGKLTDNSGTVIRSTSRRIPNEYIKSAEPFSYQKVAGEDLPGEFLMNVLRLKEGFELDLFRKRTGLADAMLGNFLEAAISKGLIAHGDRMPGDKIIPTERGFQHLNELLLLAI